MNLEFNVLTSDCLRHILFRTSSIIRIPSSSFPLHLNITAVLMCFLFSGSTVRTSLSLARDSAIMIELCLPSPSAPSPHRRRARVTTESGTHFSHEWERGGRAYLRVGFECFVKLSVEQADLRFVLCDALARGLARLLELTKADIRQGFGIVVKYPLVVIKIDDKICRLA